MGRAARTWQLRRCNRTEWSAAMPQPNDLSRSLVALDHNSTIIAVVELSQSSWLVGGVLPGIGRQPRKKLEPSPERLLALLHRWRDESVRAGCTITRIAVAFEAGRDGFWLARWLEARGVEAHVIHPSSTRLAQFGVLEREALSPPRRPGEFVEEPDVVGAFRRLAAHFGDLGSVRPDENPPAIGLDAVEDDGRGLCSAGQRLFAKTPLELGHEVAQLIIRQLRDVAAQQSKSLSRLRETGSIDRVRFAIAAVDLARVGADRGPDLAGHDNRAFDVRRVDPQISDQRLCEPLDGEFRGRIGGMRDAWPDRGPKAVDATGIDDVALLGVLQHRQKRAGAVIDAAPADVERALPFVAAIGNHAPAAADTRVVEQQVDLVGLVAVGNLVAKPLDLRPVGDISDVRRDPQPLRQTLRLAQSLRFRQAGRRDIAHRDIVGFRHQLADQLAAHAAAAAGDYRGPPSEFGHVYLSLAFRGRSRYGPSPTSPPVEKRSVGAMSGRQAPANLARELLEEIDIVGALGRPADQFIDLMSVRPHQNTPLVGLDPLENDR